MMLPLFIAGLLTELLDAIGIPFGIATNIAAILTFLIVFAALYVIGVQTALPVLSRLLRNRGLEEHARRPLLKGVRFVIIFAAIAIAFGLAGYGSFLTALATISAAATLAVGFAMQNVIQNFVSGVFIFVEQPFKIGDWVEWNDNAGVVEDISLRVTRVRTFDNELLTVPNSELTDNVVKNPVAKDRLRLKLLFGIGYEDDIEEASNIIVEEAKKHDQILDDPAPAVRLTELGDSDVGLQARIWVAEPKRADVVKVRSEYTKAVKERFDEAGIDIPYPHRELLGGIDVSDRPVPSEATSER